jgi:hypothetical protein
VHIPVPYYLHSRAILPPSSPLPSCEPCTHTHTHTRNPPVPCPWPESPAGTPAEPVVARRASSPSSLIPSSCGPIPSHPIPRDHPRARTVVQLADLAQSNRFGLPVHHNPASPVLCAVCYRLNDCQPPTRSLRLTTTLPLLDRLLACATTTTDDTSPLALLALSLHHSARLASVASYPGCSI